ARPSGPPTISATSWPSPCQASSRRASARVVRSAPRSSRITRRQRGGSAASMRAASAIIIASTVLPLVRGSALTSMSCNGSSRGMRRANSSKPACTHPGMRWPTATTKSFTSARGGAAAGQRRVPQLFELVVRAHRRLHHMDDDAAEVDQHPFAGLLAFGADDLAAGFLDLVVDVLRQRARLPAGFGAGDDDAVEQRGEFRGVDDFDVARLDVFQRGDDDFFEGG